MKASLKRRKVLMAVGYSIIEFKKDYILADILHTAEMKCMRKKNTTTLIMRQKDVKTIYLNF